MNAAFYYRAAEFFKLPSDPDKESLYDRFVDIFYQKAFVGETFERFLVPYEHTHLPVIRVPSTKPACSGTIVIHGGFDSYIEEFYSLAVYFSKHGYEVILFEGPGQGAALSCPAKNECELPGEVGDKQPDVYHKNADTDGCNGYIASVQ